MIGNSVEFDHVLSRKTFSLFSQVIEGKKVSSLVLNEVCYADLGVVRLCGVQRELSGSDGIEFL